MPLTPWSGRFGVDMVQPSTAVARRDHLFTSEEEAALVGFLAGYGALDA
jgi:hypothetical protein